MALTVEFVQLYFQLRARNRTVADLFNQMKELVRPSNDNLVRYYLKKGNTGKYFFKKRMHGEMDLLKEKLDAMKARVVIVEVNATT